MTTTYTNDGTHILREVRGSSTLRYVRGSAIDEMLAVDDGSALVYFHADGLGSVTKTTDSAGVVTFTRRYDAWGNLEVGGTEPRPSFTGREWDPETGLYYYRARYYEPGIARFLSEDPIGLSGAINFYVYAADAPAIFTDPYGLYSFGPGYGQLPLPFRPPGKQPCKPNSCVEKCLAKIFGTLPPITVSPNAAGIAPALGYAMSGHRSITLPVDCDSFYSEPDWVLHEYYHVVYQWEPGPVGFAVAYLGQAFRHGFRHDDIPAERQAEEFAQRLKYAFEQCLEQCNRCSK